MAKDKKTTDEVIGKPLSAIDRLKQILAVSTASGITKKVLYNEYEYSYLLDENGKPTKRTQLKHGRLPNGAYGYSIHRETGLKPLIEVDIDGNQTILAYGFNWTTNQYSTDKKTIIGETPDDTWDFSIEDAEILEKASQEKLIKTRFVIDRIHRNSESAGKVGFCVCRVDDGIKQLTGSGEMRRTEKESRVKAYANTTASITEQFETIQSRKNAKAYKDLETETDFG